MTEEEKEQLEREFQYALDNIISKIKGETATAIVHSEQSMILLFKKIMFKLDKQQKTIQEQNNFIEKLVKEHKEEIEKLKKNRDIQRELINDAVFDGYEKNYKSQLEDFTKEIDRLKNIIKSFESGEMVIGVKK